LLVGVAEAKSFFLPPHPWETKTAAAIPKKAIALYIIQVSVDFPALQSFEQGKVKLTCFKHCVAIIIGCRVQVVYKMFMIH